MAAISATSYATPSAQARIVRARLEQARREADQAESNARQLRAQADQAEQDARADQARVSSLGRQVTQEDSAYSAKLSNQVAASEAKRAQDTLVPVSTAASNKFSFPENPLKTDARAWSAVNQAPSSGRFVDLSV
jgi:chromosome segregation ATPase